MRRLVLIVAVLLVACARPAPELVTDAGSTGQSGSVIYGHSIVSGTVDTGDSHVIYDHTIVNGVDVTSRDAPSRLRGDAGARDPRVLPTPWAKTGGARNAKTRASKDPKFAPPHDPRVDECGAKAADGASLMACFEALKSAPPVATGPDAGHRLGDARQPAVNPVCSVSDWYIRASTGLDTHTCIGSGAACKTRSEINARMGGIECPLTVVTTIHALEDMPLSDLMDWRPKFSNVLATANIVGASVAVGSGSMSGVVQKSHTGGQALNANLGASAATFVGFTICDTTHASCGFVDKIVSGNVAQITQPVDATGFNELDVWTSGDAFIVTRPVNIYAQEIDDTTVTNVTIKPVPGFTRVFDTFVVGSIQDPASSIEAMSSTFANDYTPGSLIMSDSSLIAGSNIGAFVTSSAAVGNIGTDVILHGNVAVAGTIEQTYDYVYMDGAILDVAGGRLLPVGASAFYGVNYHIEAVNGFVVYEGYNYPTTATAANAFLGSAFLTIFGNSAAVACDRSHDPEQCHPNVTLDQTHLDTNYAGGGFNGIAIANYDSAGFINFNNGGVPITPTPYVAPPANGGLGLSSICGAGQVPQSNGSSYVCTTPAGGSASCPINLATCVTNVLGTTNGGTGDSSLSSGSLLVGGGTGAVTTLAPGTNGNVATASGGVWTSAPNTSASCPINLASCIVGVLGVVNGGTGGNNCSAGGVVTGNGTSPFTCTTYPANDIIVSNGTSLLGVAPVAHDMVIVNGSGQVSFLAPGTAGSMAISNGTDWLAVAGPLAHSFGGTDVNAVGAAGNVLTSNGSNWTSATPAAPFDVYSTSSGGLITATTGGTTVSNLTFTARNGHLDISVDIPEVSQGAGGVNPIINIQPFVGSTPEASWAAIAPSLTPTFAAGGSWHGWISVPAGLVSVSVVATTASATSGVDCFLQVKSYGF